MEPKENGEEVPTTSGTVEAHEIRVQTPEKKDAVATVNITNTTPRRFRKLFHEELRRKQKSRLNKIPAMSSQRQLKHTIPPRNYAVLLKRLKAKNQTQTTSGNRHKQNGKRKLKLNESQVCTNNSSSVLEEGEIFSDESIIQDKPTDVDDDDDCIIVEENVEPITIVDDCEQSGTSFAAPAFASFVEQQLKKRDEFSSTPHLKKSQRGAELKENNTDAIIIDCDIGENKNVPVLEFSVDVTPTIPCVQNDQPDYFPGVSTVREKSTTKRRSKRHHPSIPTLKDEQIITLDDTNDMTLPTCKRSKTLNDSSVIFVSETNAGSPTYIPLQSDNVPNPIKVPKTPELYTRRRSPDLFTNSERKKLQVYNENTYNPNPIAEHSKNKKRFVVIDGSNVAFSHGRSKCFSVKGLKICIEYFEKMGHQVKCVVPLYRQNRYKSTEPEELERLYGEGKVIYTPCKNLPGNSASSYDDRFILQIASQFDAAIISNDNYRDLLNENEAFKKLIENRVVGYTWCDDMFMLPKDPYGRNGPPLHAILNCR